MSGIVSFAMIQRNTSLLADYRWQQQLLDQAQKNLISTANSLNQVGQDLQNGSVYFTLFQQQLAAINQLEKQITLQMAQLQNMITILEKDSESQQKIVEKWREKAFSYFA
jgi:selenocysteine-specific translation elongation factor